MFLEINLAFFFTLRFLIYILERDICITSKESTFVSRHSREMLLFSVEERESCHGEVYEDEDHF